MSQQTALPVGDTRAPTVIEQYRRTTTGDLATLAMAAHEYHPIDVRGWQTHDYDDVLRQVICDGVEGTIARVSPHCEDTRGELVPVGPSEAGQKYDIVFCGKEWFCVGSAYKN